MTEYLKEIWIQGFRGFGLKQSVKMAIPKSDKTGSGLTIIVGEINTGKSTILEAIKKLNDSAKILPKERHHGIETIIEFIDSNDKRTIVKRGNKATVDIVQEGAINASKFEIVQARRHWRHVFNAQSVQNYAGYLLSSNFSDSKYSIDENLGAMLEKIADKNKLKFNELMKKLIPNFSDWEIDTDNDGRDIINYKINDSTLHDTSLLGDGLISLFKICTHLIDPNKLILYIDEPELSLSPSIQKNLARILADASKEKQIILNTHSTQILTWYDIINGARLHRTYKNPEKSCCEIKLLNSDDSSFKNIMSNLRNWQKPYMLDSVAKELFFSTKVLFLEGQEDVGLIKNFIVEQNLFINFDIFGYGAGGS